MQPTNSHSVSVIIPCYNEEESIDACLSALAVQTVTPLEVIIVDNNCTDRTAQIAARYDFVRVIRERQPGLIAARDTGFASAKGSILARIDADSIVAPNWIESVQRSFTRHQTMQAVTGTGKFYDAPLRFLHLFFRELIAVWFNRVLCSHYTLWGANMAVRRSAWQAISQSVCRKSDIMEDIDISIHLFDFYGRRSVRFDRSIQAETSLRRATSSFYQLLRYFKMWPATLRSHGYWGAWLTWPAIIVALLNNIWVRVLVRLYDPELGKLVISSAQWRQRADFDRDNP